MCPIWKGRKKTPKDEEYTKIPKSKIPKTLTEFVPANERKNVPKKSKEYNILPAPRRSSRKAARDRPPSRFGSKAPYSGEKEKTERRPPVHVDRPRPKGHKPTTQGGHITHGEKTAGSTVVQSEESQRKDLRRPIPRELLVDEDILSQKRPQKDEKPPKSKVPEN